MLQYLFAARKPQSTVTDTRNLTERTLDLRQAQMTDMKRHRDSLLVRQQQIENELYHAEVSLRSLQASMDVLEAAMKEQDEILAEEINRSFEEQLSEPGRMQPMAHPDQAADYEYNPMNLDQETAAKLAAKQD